jgi:UDP:flavonoid glycosyltransferase YjiC (YdhE family)
VIAATAGRIAPTTVPDNARVAEFLSGEAACQVADVVVCNGGSPTSYQALSAGKPVVGIASNMDQYLNMSLVHQSGAGRLLRGGHATEKSIGEAVAEALANERFAQRARALQQVLEGYHGSADFESLVSKITNAGAA